MVMMPPGAATARGAQKAALAGVLYDKQTDAELGKLLSELLSNQQGLNEWEAANVRDGECGGKCGQSLQAGRYSKVRRAIC